MIYLIILVVFLLFAVKACCFTAMGQERIKRDFSIGSILEKTAAEIYRWIPVIPGKNTQTLRNLIRLHPEEAAGQLKYRYDIERLKNILLILLLGDIAALFLWINGLKEESTVDAGYLIRSGQGTKSTQFFLTAVTENGETVGTSLTVQPRRYTVEELEVMYEEIIEKISVSALGENASWDCVSTDLCFMENVEGYPFTLTWSSGDYRFISGNGTVADWREVKDLEIQEALVLLICRITYYDFVREHSFYAFVCPDKEKTDFPEAVCEALKQAEEEDPYGSKVHLPETVQGRMVTWSQQQECADRNIFLLALAGAAGVWILKEREIKNQLREKNSLLESEYPAVISKLTLYLGAGMNLKGAWAKTAVEGGKKYEKKRNPVYGEMLLTVREMESGISEAEAYERFGKRVRLQRYIRLTTLLVQNLKKGNAALLLQLRQESFLALEEKASSVKKAGEETGTKLLLPMMLMMGMVMVLIMVPAFLSF